MSTPVTDTPQQPRTLSDFARKYTHHILNPPAKFLHARHVHPDTITFVGLLIVIGAAVAISQGYLWQAGVILLIGLPLDALDGAVARLRTDLKQRPFGGFWDSTLDRYADGLIFGALAFYGKTQESDTILFLALTALVGALMVSYTRARAEGLGYECKVGLFTRMERIVAIFILLFTGWVLPLLWILAIGTHVTVLQRIWQVWQATQPTPLSEQEMDLVDGQTDLP